jgi:signal transduction histidine kinase
LSIRKNILKKRTVIITLIGFSFLITTGIALIFKSRVGRDSRYVQFVQLAGGVENEILKARISIDEIMLREDRSMVPDLKQNLDKVRSLLLKLHNLINENYLNFIERDFGEFRLQYQLINEHLDELEEIVYAGDSLNMLTPGNKLITAFNQFTVSYENYESNLPELLLLDNKRYRLQIIGIVILNLGFLFLAGFLILRLIHQLIQADRNLMRKTIDVENRERERIAADLHDGLGSLLSGIIIHIQVLEKEYDKTADLKRQLKHLNYLSNHALLSIEEVINNLNPSSLARNGLIKSMRKNISKINELGKTQFSINANELDIQFPESTESLLYRICNELINNALKHSGAKNAEFRFFNIKKEFHLVYKDDGVGFSPELKSYEEDKGGLYNLMRRVESLEGDIKINSQPDKGVVIEIVFNIG